MTARISVLLAVLVAALVALPTIATAFDCAELKCREMSSCAEAHHKYKVCGHSKRDADDDGIPCEDLCGKTMATYQARVRAQSQPGGAAMGGAAASEMAPEGALGLIGPAPAARGEPSDVAPKFSCGAKRKCGQMLTCEEARFHLNTCGVRSLDGDRDGVPCNSLCR